MVTVLVGATLIFSSLSVMFKFIIVSAAVYGIAVVARLPLARDEPPVP